MSHLLDDDDDNLDGHQNQRELTLSASSVLGIFFGFGYNMGNKSKQAAQSSNPDTSADTTASTTNFNSFKPAPGSTTGQPVAVYPTSTSSGSPSIPPPSIPANSGSGPVLSVPPASASHADTAADTTPAKPPSAPPISLQTAPATPPAPATGYFVVQVAAVSHQEDADLLVGALRGKGYSVNAHAEPQDKLIHIQVGPFNNRKDADAMRQRLLSDGYNAIVK